MIPILFPSTETAFTSNGIGRLTDAVSCKVTEERNGVYECEFEYPMTGKLYNELITNGGIIYCTHDDNGDPQPFDIYKRSAPINGIVKFYAHHISYRLNRVIVRPFTAASIADTMTALVTNSVNANPFTFTTNKTISSDFELAVPKNAREILAGSVGSLLDVYGKGEYKFDKWTVSLLTNRGTNSGVTIRYGKNLSEINHEIDDSECYNAVAPYWVGAEGETVYPSSVIVQSPSTTGDPKAVPLDLSTYYTEKPTEAELTQKALDYLASNEPWVPHENIKVDFIALWQTEDYKDLAPLLKVSLCDTVSVYYPKLGVTAAHEKVVKVVYDTLLERYDSIELGQTQASFAQTIQMSIADQLTGVPTIENVRTEISNSADLIAGNYGGYVVFIKDADGHPTEILIMDTDDTSTATNVIRFNQNGIGFSTSGIAGPYSNAWTIDGKLDADFVTTGKLSSENGKVYFDLDNAIIRTEGKIGLDSYYSYVDGTGIHGTLAEAGVSTWGFQCQTVGSAHVQQLKMSRSYVSTDWLVLIQHDSIEITKTGSPGVLITADGIKIGGTSLSETQLQQLLALI